MTYFFDVSSSSASRFSVTRSASQKMHITRDIKYMVASFRTVPSFAMYKSSHCVYYACMYWVRRTCMFVARLHIFLRNQSRAHKRKRHRTHRHSHTCSSNTFWLNIIRCVHDGDGDNMAMTEIPHAAGLTPNLVVVDLCACHTNHGQREL